MVALLLLLLLLLQALLLLLEKGGVLPLVLLVAQLGLQRERGRSCPRALALREECPSIGACTAHAALSGGDRTEMP